MKKVLEIISLWTWISTHWVTLLGNISITSIISIIVSIIINNKERKQHQKDVTVREIINFKQRLENYNPTLIQYIHNYQGKKESPVFNKIEIAKSYSRARSMELRMMSYISSWSVNVKFNRINRKMVKYSSKRLLMSDYRLLKTIINKYLDKGKSSPYFDIAKKSRKFFKSCGIINIWKRRL